MKITDVRIFIRTEHRDKKLRAFATMTIDDCFVVRDIKVIDGAKGLFVAMPSRRLKEPCPKCRNRNAVRSSYCSQCGMKLKVAAREVPDFEEEAALRQSEHKDMAHPITSECRRYVQETVLAAYREEKEKLGNPEN